MGLEMKLCKLNTLTAAFELRYPEDPAAWGAFLSCLLSLSFVALQGLPFCSLRHRLCVPECERETEGGEGKLFGIMVMLKSLGWKLYLLGRSSFSLFLSGRARWHYVSTTEGWGSESDWGLSEGPTLLSGTGPSSTTLSSPCFSENSVIKQHNTIHLSSTFCCWYLFVLLWLFYFLTICSSVNNVTELCWYMLRNITVMLAGPTNLILHLLNRTILCVREEVRTV